MTLSEHVQTCFFFWSGVGDGGFSGWLTGRSQPRDNQPARAAISLGNWIWPQKHCGPDYHLNRETSCDYTQKVLFLLLTLSSAHLFFPIFPPLLWCFMPINQWYEFIYKIWLGLSISAIPSLTTYYSIILHDISRFRKQYEVWPKYWKWCNSTADLHTLSVTLLPVLLSITCVVNNNRL